MNLTDPQEILTTEQRVEYRATIEYLLERMEQRNVAIANLRAYYGGKPPMPWAHRKARSAYHDLLAQARSNFPLLIVDTVADRLSVEGFRLDGEEADQMVWADVWQANSMGIFGPQVQREAVLTGIAYISVLAGTSPGTVRIRGELADEVFHDPDPDDPLAAARAVKVWGDLVAKRKLLRYVDRDVVIYASAPWDPRAEPRPEMSATSWVIDDITPNPRGSVPFIPMLNRPTLNGGSESELEGLLGHFNKINTLTVQMLLAAELGAFKIRWATGMDIPTDKNGNPVEPFDVALDRLWINREPDGKFGSFEATDIAPYMNAVDQAVQQVAAISRTPPFLLMGKVTNLSAEALKGTESGLVQKVRERQRSFGESWQRVIQEALSILGDPRADMTEMEVMWRDPENVSEAQRVDALSKLYALGLPWKAVMERYGATPGEINRWEAMRAEDLFARMMLASANNPATPLLGAGQQQEERPAIEQGEQEPEEEPVDENA